MTILFALFVQKIKIEKKNQDEFEDSKENQSDLISISFSRINSSETFRYL